MAVGCRCIHMCCIQFENCNPFHANDKKNDKVRKRSGKNEKKYQVLKKI